MERERLTQLLKSPGQVAREDLADLRSLAERYPWFSGAQVLRASGEGLVGDVRSDETLASAAAHVPSRAVLYDLAASRLYNSNLGAPMSVVGGDNKLAGRSAEEALLPAVARVPDTDPAPPAEPEPAVLEALLPDSSAPDTPKEAGLHAALDAPSGSEGTPVADEADPLEQQIIEAALASAYDLSLHAPLPPVEQGSEVDDDLPGSSMAPSTGPQPPRTGGNPEEEYPKSSGTAGHPVSPKPINRDTRKRFSSWLDQDGSDAQPAVRKKTTSPSASELPAPTAQDPPGVSPAKPLAPEERMSIVDRFIGQEIQAPATKAAFFTPQQAAKRSLDDTAGLVTETLAKIYAKQGNTAKAIEAYGKLALKYPEKSTYFAGLLQALEAQQNK